MLAPMAGFTAMPYRSICREHGCDFNFTEMISAKGLKYGGKSADLMDTAPNERPCGIQLFGRDPDIMAEMDRRICGENKGELALIDINMGCPAPKIAGNRSGSALRLEPDRAESIIRAVKEASSIPVTVKFRKGWDDSHINAVEFAQMAEAAGADAVTVHGRTRQQMDAPPVDWEIIRQVKNAVSIPGIGNGDVVSPETAKALYETTGCDLIMIGRGALGAPWLFRQVRQYLQTGAYEPPPPLEKRMELMVEQMTLAVQYKGERVASHEARKHCGWYISGVRGAAQLRRRAVELQTLDDIKRLAEDVVKAAAE